MRIAYISLHWARTFSSGVGKKIHRQIRNWESLGHEARLFMHCEATHDPNLLPGEKFFYPIQTGIPQRELGRIHAAKKMLQAVKSYQPNIIYLRYGIYVYSLHRLAFIAPIVEEINTNDVEQHKELGLPYDLYNRATRGLFLNAVRGLSCVSQELAESPVFAKYQKPTQVIANGINLKQFQPLEAPANGIPRILFLGGPGHSWHGIDKIVRLAQDIPDIHVDIIGYQELPEDLKASENLSLHGYLFSRDYLSILEQADVAISSLAMHRVKLHEASPLKSREYLAYGLPMILAYKDTDLDQLDVNYLLKIPNTEDNIITHGKLIRDFAYAMRGKRVNREEIAPYIDSRIKEEKRLAFFQEIIDQR